MGRPTNQINLQLREVFRRNEWYDPDDYALRLAGRIDQQLENGMPLTNAVETAIDGVETEFFRVNRGARGRLGVELQARLRELRLKETSTLDVLLRFKKFAERQLVHDLKSGAEAPGRGLLQAYLERGGRTDREVEAGGGRADIFLLAGTGREIVETKVWRGQAYHDDGLEELSRYLAAEGRQVGYVVVFEFYKIDPVTPDTETREVAGRVIEVVYVHVPLTPPSKVGAARRKRH